MTVRTVSVIAPATLGEGYTFDATVDGTTFTVTVPEGGVQEGESFQVPYPEDDIIPMMHGQPAMNQPAAASGGPVVTQPKKVGQVPKGDVVTGSWRKNLCSCCETCCCPFWMGYCFPGVLLGQIMQRNKLDPIAREGSEYNNTCFIVSAISIIFGFLLVVLGATESATAVIYLPLLIYVVYNLTIVRSLYRQRYNIRGSCCGEGYVDDCCCSFWCFCCVLFQVHRHDHDELQYPYDMTSFTGLGPSAPEVV